MGKLSIGALLALSLSMHAFAAEPVIRSCARLSGQEKAQCEWENHKAYKEMAKSGAFNAQLVTPEEPAAPAIVLPSCARLLEKEKAQCLYENHKKIKEALKGEAHSTAASTSSPSTASSGSKRGKATGVPATCRALKGKERAKCIIEQRKAGRK